MTKIATLLDTKNRKEQEKRVEYLINQAQTPIFSINLVIQGERVQYGFIGQPEPGVILKALDVVRDDILAAVVAQKLKQGQAEEFPPEEMEEPEEVPLEPEEPV